MTFEWTEIESGKPPWDEHGRVLVYTEGTDFSGQQFFDIPILDFYLTEQDDALGELGTEVTRAVTHWRALPYPARAPQIASTGLTLSEQSTGGGFTALASNALPMGLVLVTRTASDVAPTDPEHDDMTITVQNCEGNTVAQREVKGRSGLNDLYAELVGYRPDDECYEPDPLRLLALVAEMLYRLTMGDAN